MLFTTSAFPGFGPNRFEPRYAEPPGGHVTGKKPAELREAVRRSAPKLPGVYGMIDPRGRLTYVGKAKVLRSRLMSYFRTSSRDPKAGKIIAQARAVVWEQSPSEFAALLRELELIRQFCPPYNVLGQPGRLRFSYLCLGRKPAPYFYRHREISSKALANFGPLPGSRRLGDAIRRLNDLFRLRDCPQTVPLKFADQKELFPIIEPAGCLRYEIGTCTGPCVQAVSQPQYTRLVRQAKAFLEARDLQPIEQLRAEMNRAATEQRYEKAAALRDRIDDLVWLQERLAWLQNARKEYTFIYPVESIDGPGLWYFIRGGRVLAATAAPQNSRSAKVAGKMVTMVYPMNGIPSVIPNDLYDHVLLVSGWFRKHPDERNRTLSVDAAIRRCGPVAIPA